MLNIFCAAAIGAAAFTLAGSAVGATSNQQASAEASSTMADSLSAASDNRSAQQWGLTTQE